MSSTGPAAWAGRLGKAGGSPLARAAGGGRRVVARADRRLALLGLLALAHASAAPMLLYGRPWHWAVALLVYCLGSCLGGTMTYHRLLAHRAWRAPRWLECAGTLAAAWCLSGSSIAWVAVHREHHRRADQPGDPHSPRHKGLLYAQWLSALHAPDLRYARDLCGDPFHRFCHRRYLVLLLAGAGTLAAFDPFAVVYAWLFPSALVWNAGSAVNSLCHTWGARPHATPDESRNNRLVALLVWGEGWHNNHHARPGDPWFGRKPGEIDVGGWLIARLGRPADDGPPARRRSGRTEP